MERLLWIGLGGALGTIARYGIVVLCQSKLGAFPYGTIAVNLLGSFLLGALVQATLTSDLVSPTMRLALGTGVLGGFTTYSTFNADTVELLDRQMWPAAAANVAVTVFGSLALGFAGMYAVRRAIG